ncbi:hypothetical protein BDV36DRAFT_256234 [Aspergillus pseudocaelatus]|uniref:Uncharacterized protein n=1 Tax=Aspergillus pseudocaelatus TaxID=1825620 RepID=A0ABQ6WKT3_9EURO|nr:hypothetical protein BDV36DRAFT_256234 [Aspergillus pseudocaelatus]
MDLIYPIGCPCVFLVSMLGKNLKPFPFYLSPEQEQWNPHSSGDFISCYISLIIISHSFIRNQERRVRYFHCLQPFFPRVRV